MTTKSKVVMFIDQVRSAVGSAQRTSTDIKKIAAEQNSLIMQVLDLTGGIMLQAAGEGCFVQFNSALEAVQAGILLQQRVANRNTALKKHQLRFELHIGIDIGDLYTSDAGDLSGNVINRCTRIGLECPPGEVYLTDTAGELLDQNEAELATVGTVALKGIPAKVGVYRLATLYVWPTDALTPFFIRGGITQPEYFFDRDLEQDQLRAYISEGQNCQIVGPRFIGKTSLLRQIERVACEWSAGTLAVYLDLRDPQCSSLSGWLHQVSKKFGFSETVSNLSEFAESVEAMIRRGVRPVLCLDEFEELALRRAEFTPDFFLTLRSCGNEGLSIITTSRLSLSEMTDRNDPTSPFYNTFPLLRLGPFADGDARDFVIVHRPGVPQFTSEETNAILEFAKGHPLALQVACFQVVYAKMNGENVSTGLGRTADYLNACSYSW